MAAILRSVRSLGIPAAVLLVALAACATTTGALVDHTFAFNAGLDSPDIEIIDYRYGATKQPGARNDHPQRDQGKSAQGTGVTGPMLKGDDLYVKWRIKSTGAVHEDTVDLRHRLPPDITGQRVYFIVRGPQLYVYLVSRERRPPDTPAIGSRLWSHLQAIQIYPRPTHNACHLSEDLFIAYHHSLVHIAKWRELTLESARSSKRGA